MHAHTLLARASAYTEQEMPAWLLHPSQSPAMVTPFLQSLLNSFETLGYRMKGLRIPRGDCGPLLSTLV